MVYFSKHVKKCLTTKESLKRFSFLVFIFCQEISRCDVIAGTSVPLLFWGIFAYSCTCRDIFEEILFAKTSFVIKAFIIEKYYCGFAIKLR